MRQMPDHLAGAAPMTGFIDPSIRAARAKEQRNRHSAKVVEVNPFENEPPMTNAPSSPDIVALATKLLDFIDAEGPEAKAWQPISETAAALRASLQPAIPTAACPYKGPFGCKCEPGECKYAPTMPDDNIDAATGTADDQGRFAAGGDAVAGDAQAARESGPVDPAMTPTEFVDSILSACDPSNWDADRNKVDYYRGLHDAYEHIHEIANEYQTAMYGWTRARDAAQPSGETEQHLREENLRSLLREARLYVSEAYCNEDNEVQSHSKSLLCDIDQALSISSTHGDTP